MPNSLSCPEVKALLQRGGQLIDVRTPPEHHQFALPGSINIPLHHLAAAGEQINPQRPVLVYCRSGARSEQARQFLQQQGFREVYNLGGVAALAHCA